MEIAILGAGPIGLGMASFLHTNGHAPVLWSPSGRSTAPFAEGQRLTSVGRIETSFAPRVAASCADALAGAQVVIVAVPGYGHRAVMDAAAPHLRADQTVIISSQYSLSALYLSKIMTARGVTLPIIAWATTLTTGRRKSPVEVHVSSLRNQLDMATIPVTAQEASLALCRNLFGDRFRGRDDVLAITLSNLNPPVHMAMALCNLTRIEKAEDWPIFFYVTDSVGRLIEALDQERLALASAFGLTVRTVYEHYHLSFNVPFGSVAEMTMAVHTGRGSPSGPKSLESRFLTEDIPFGLAPLSVIAKAIGVPLPLHDAGIELVSTLCGRDYRSENNLIGELQLAAMQKTALHDRVRAGWRNF